MQSKTRSSFLKNNLAYMILGANGDCTCGSCDLNIVNKQDITDLKYLLRRGGDSSFCAELFVLISHNANFELPPAQVKPSTVGTIYVVNSHAYPLRPSSKKSWIRCCYFLLPVFIQRWGRLLNICITAI